MNNIESKFFSRQLRRYRPSKNNCYFDLNNSLSSELDSVKELLVNKNILDIGCGEQPFAEFFIGLNVDTCDVVQNSTGGVKYIIQPNSPFPFGDNSYDVICLFDVLEHVKEDIAFIKECNRILTIGGLILSNTPFMYRFHEEPNDYRRYTPSGLLYLFEDVAGFKIEKLVPIGSPLFSAAKLLSEKGFHVPFHRRLIYRFFTSTLMFLRNTKEVGEKCPFSYFVLASKLK